MNTHPKKKNLWRAAAAVLAGAVLAMTFAAPASAAPLVDATQKGSIAVHKFEQPKTSTGLAHNGTQVDTTGLTAIPGVTFLAQQVNTIDLTTNAGWKKANTLSTTFKAADSVGTINAAGFTLAAGASQITDASGTALFGNLPVGLYLVTETGVPAGVTAAAPFLVSVPLTDPTNKDNWLYNVHVYPKNSKAGVTKTVQDAAGVKLGDEITFTIQGDIPDNTVVAGVETITGYKITDTLDPKLTYANKTVVTLVKSDGTAGPALAAGTDYTVVHDGIVAPGTNTVSIEFTTAGRAILAANNTSTVKVVLSATVNTIGEIENTAALYPNQSSITTGIPVVTPPVVTKWGEITLKKVNGAGTALTGAEFSVYTSLANAKAGTNAVSLGGKTVFPVTAANGELTISGLRYSDWADGKTLATNDPAYRTYYLVETKAPVGYELLAEPISFLVTAATTAVGVDLNVVNVPSNSGFELPFTGGPGTLALYIGGGLLLAGAVVFFVRSRRATN
ncbi:SpaH/EbpB family LPXTG-anchored major pilin [Leifsonia kafniensis]|uniref:SpaH/EbpB family LPXTG-anchored major pilin n=1 Tax=Leifsonia kafniensis TaxID=475957 RepID=A0ABP7L6C4_9MICO